MKDYIQEFKKYLKKNNLKYTLERKDIVEAIIGLDKHFDAEQIYQQLRKQASDVSLATIYRTIPILIDSGLISETLHCRDKVVYEKVFHRGHHDHMICIRCGKIIEFYNEDIEKLQNEICKKYHFLPVEHRLGIKGYCKECQKEIEKEKKNI
mgnify:CR=1 FL=1